jgi:hypothetical protein
LGAECAQSGVCAAAIYSVSDWILFRANLFPADVYLIGGRNDQQGLNPMRFDYMVRAYETQTAAISDFAKAAACAGNIVVDGQPVGASWTGVSVGLFPMLGIRPSLGRGFLRGEDVAGADGVVVVSYRFWQQHLGGKADALGESPLLARLRGLLVVLQAAFAVVLLAGAGVMIRTFLWLENLDLGFDPAGRAKVMVSFPAGYHVGRDSRLARLREIREELMRQPGVREVGFGNDVVMPGYYFATNTVEGPKGRPVRTALVGINGTYGAAAGPRLKRGRWLDRPNGNEILVNEVLAREC